MRWLAVALFLFCAQAKAEWESWNDLDKALLTASTGLLALDWLQTRQIAENRHPGYDFYGNQHSGFNFYEKNPLLGAHPSLHKVNVYFGSAIGLNYFVADSLGKNRAYWLAGVTALEFNIVRGNYKVGVRVGF